MTDEIITEEVGDNTEEIETFDLTEGVAADETIEEDEEEEEGDN